MKTSLRKISLSLAVLAAIGVSSGCNRGSDSHSDGAPAKTVTDTLSTSLLTKAPYGILGYYHWSLGSPAYSKLEASPWKGSVGTGLDASSAANPLNDSPAYQAFKDAGIDFTNPSTLTDNLGEVVLFVSPGLDPAKSDMPMELGALLSAKSGVDFAQKFSAIRESLRKQQIAATDTTFGDLKGFETAINTDDTDGADAPRHFYVAYSSQHAVLGTTRNVVQLTVDNLAKGGKLPEIVTKDSHRTLSSGFLNSAQSYATGFIDIEKLVQLAKSSAKDATANNLDNIPLRAGAISSWMATAPGTDASFLLWPKNEEQKKLLSSLGSATSEPLLAIVPESPMLFVSLDGSLFKLGENMVEDPQAGGASPLAVLKEIRRTIIAAKPAAVGQSLLPVPEIIVGLETTDSAKVSSTLSMLVESALPPGPVDAAGSSNKSIDGVAVKQIVTPLGVSLFIGSVDQVVLLATSEAQMTGAIASLKGRTSAFVKKLSASQRKSLVETPNAAALHLDFPQVATFVESISSLLQMYGAGGPEAKGAFGTPEQVEAIRKRGALTGSARVNGEVLEVKSFYSPSV